MAQIVLLPKEGITVESCLIGAWKKGIGDKVAEGDALFEYETDKATFECISTAEGVLLHKFYQEGVEAEVLTPAAIVGEEGEDITSLMTKDEEPAAAVPAEPAAVAVESATVAVESAAVAESIAAAQAEPADPEKIIASPRAKSFAKEQGIDLGLATPTGPGGRILEADMIKAANVYRDTGEAIAAGVPAAEAPSAETPPAAAAYEASFGMAAEGAPPAATGTGIDEAIRAGVDPGQPSDVVFADERFSKTREVIAKTMMTSLQRSAQLTHHHSFDATNVLAMREDFKALDEKYGYGGVSVGDIILYVTSRVLAKHPEINALVADEGVRKYSTVNLGVAIDTPHGLLVPTVFGAEKKSLREISSEVKTLAAAARERRISLDKLQGGTFTVSNLGVTGVEIFTPIINPPQAAIIGVCGVVERVRKGACGQIEVYPSIGISLTYDHRAVDGAPASRFNAELCKTLAEFSWKTLALENA